MELRHREYDEALKARWRRKIAVVVSSFRLYNIWAEIWWKRWFVIISCRIISDHVDTGHGQMISESKGTPVFSSVMPPKAVAAGSQTSNRTEEGCSPQGGQGRFAVLRCVFQRHRYNTSFHRPFDQWPQFLRELKEVLLKGASFEGRFKTVKILHDFAADFVRRFSCFSSRWCLSRIWCRIAYIDPQSFGLFALILKSLAAQKMIPLEKITSIWGRLKDW